MTEKRTAALIEQEVKRPAEDIENSGALAKPLPERIATTQNTQIAAFKLAGKSLFEESKELWAEFVEADRKHQLAQHVGAQLWRLTKIVGKPALILSFSGIRAAIITVASPEHRAALKERFSRSQLAKGKNASLELTELTEE